MRCELQTPIPNEFLGLYQKLSKLVMRLLGIWSSFNSLVATTWCSEILPYSNVTQHDKMRHVREGMSCFLCDLFLCWIKWFYFYWRLSMRVMKDFILCHCFFPWANSYRTSYWCRTSWFPTGRLLCQLRQRFALSAAPLFVFFYCI